MSTFKKENSADFEISLKFKNYFGKNLKNYQSMKDLSRKNVNLSETLWKLQKALLVKLKAKK